MAQWMKPPPAMLAFCMGAVLSSGYFTSYLPVKSYGKESEGGLCIWAPITHGGDPDGTLNWPSPGYYSHWGMNQQIESPLSLSFSFQHCLSSKYLKKNYNKFKFDKRNKPPIKHSFTSMKTIFIVVSSALTHGKCVHFGLNAGAHRILSSDVEIADDRGSFLCTSSFMFYNLYIATHHS